MCDVCVNQKDEFEKAGSSDKLHKKSNKGTQYKFVREYERVFKDEMSLTMAKTTKELIIGLGAELGVSKA